MSRHVAPEGSAEASEAISVLDWLGILEVRGSAPSPLGSDLTRPPAQVRKPGGSSGPRPQPNLRRDPSLWASGMTYFSA